MKMGKFSIYSLKTDVQRLGNRRQECCDPPSCNVSLLSSLEEIIIRIVLLFRMTSTIGMILPIMLL